MTNPKLSTLALQRGWPLSLVSQMEQEEERERIVVVADELPRDLPPLPRLIGFDTGDGESWTPEPARPTFLCWGQGQ